MYITVQNWKQACIHITIKYNVYRKPFILESTRRRLLNVNTLSKNNKKKPGIWLIQSRYSLYN